MELYNRLNENLGKLQRNESQMTDEQKKKYAAPLKKLKKQIAADATEIMRLFLMEGCRLAEEDKDSEAWKTMIRKTEGFIDDFGRSGKMKEVSRVLFTTYSLDEFYLALLPLHYKIWYEAYGPYWLMHCTPTFENEFTFTNDIIGMEWWEDHDEWVAVKIVDGKKEVDYQGGFTIMLPPTQELLEKAYKEEMGGLEGVVK